MPYEPNCPTSSLCGFKPIFSAGFKKPKIPTVVFTAKLPTEWPSCLKSPCKILFGIDNNVPMFEVKLPVPFLLDLVIYYILWLWVQKQYHLKPY